MSRIRQVQRIIAALLSAAVLFALTGCGKSEPEKETEKQTYFSECPNLRRPDSTLYKCEEVDKKDQGDTVTYVFSLGDTQIESVALKKADEYFDQLKADGLQVRNSSYDGYYFVDKAGAYICTIGLNAIEDVGYGMVIVFDK